MPIQPYLPFLPSFSHFLDISLLVPFCVQVSIPNREHVRFALLSLASLVDILKFNVFSFKFDCWLSKIRFGYSLQLNNTSWCVCMYVCMNVCVCEYMYMCSCFSHCGSWTSRMVLYFSYATGTKVHMSMQVISFVHWLHFLWLYTQEGYMCSFIFLDFWGPSTLFSIGAVIILQSHRWYICVLFSPHSCHQFWFSLFFENRHCDLGRIIYDWSFDLNFNNNYLQGFHIFTEVYA